MVFIILIHLMDKKVMNYHMLFVRVTNISHSGHQEDFHDFIFAKLTRLLLEPPSSTYILT